MKRLKCKSCGEVFEHPKRATGGRLPSYCPKHRPSGNRTRDAARAIERGEEDLAEEIAQAPIGGEQHGRALILASLLPICGGNAVRAAEMAGFDVTPEEAEALAVEAKGGWADLASGERTASGALMGHGVGVLAARLIAAAPKVPASVLATSLKSASSALLQHNGGSRPTYSRIRLVIDGRGLPDSGGKLVPGPKPIPAGAFRSIDGQDYRVDKDGDHGWWSDLPGGPAKTGGAFCPYPISGATAHGAVGEMGDIFRRYSEIRGGGHG